MGKRSEISGNVLDKNGNNIMVHRYGSHIFHTNSHRVFNYMNQFWKLNDFSTELLTNIKGKLIPIPFNFKGIDIFFPKNSNIIMHKLIKCYGLNSRIPIMKLRNNPDKIIKEVAEFIFDNVFSSHNVLKMWNIFPEKINPSVMKRIPVNISYSDKYFHNEYEGIPKDGYKSYIFKMINNSLIAVMNNIDAISLLDMRKNKIFFNKKIFKGIVIYSGSLDALFNYKYGGLPYRSLNIKFKKFNQKKYQDAAIVNHPFHKNITRIVEHKYFTNTNVNKTIISYEEPGQYDANSNKFSEPFYPINSEDCNDMYKKYKALSDKILNFFPIGRMAMSKYMDMDSTILNALELADNIINSIEK